MHLFYLHGFASSARSTKAAFFADKLRQRGLALHTPDFNDPDFSTLTITRMIEQTSGAIAALPSGPVVLIGSSLGGFVAVQTAIRQADSSSHPMARLILLAPALEFSANRTRDLGDRGLDEWKSTGHLNVFHYGYGRLMPVHYQLFTDACGYDCANAKLAMPVQVFQGTRDTAVDPHAVEQWASSRPNVELHLLDDDHQLTASLEYIWRAIEPELR
jgi:pimeloyl-ACP methyl ester carboxylesterase